MGSSRPNNIRNLNVNANKVIDNTLDFQVKCEKWEQPTIYPELSTTLPTYIIAANGFIIFSTVDNNMADAAMLWLKKVGFKHFSKDVIEILRAQALKEDIR